LVDVTLTADSQLDIGALSRTIAQSVPGASLDDHRVWLARLIGLSRGIELLAVGIVALIGGVTSATVFYATRTGMSIHREVIQVLHVIGAPDGYIAGQFADRAFVLGFKGGFLGLALTVPVLAAISFGAHKLEGGFLADLSLPLVGWLSMLTLPFGSALLAMLTARAAAYGALAGML
jgi:cell division transport system permease protein